MKLTYLVATFVLIGSSCQDSVAPNTPRSLAMLKVLGGEVDVKTVVNGRNLEVAITSYGQNCFRTAGEDVDQQAGVILITPYDYNYGCTDRALQYLQHHVTLSNLSPGTTKIIVRGLDLTADIQNHPQGDTITVVREITVQ